MADTMVERRPLVLFFCHRCYLEFEDALQDYRCPFCSSGFIEQLEISEEELSDDHFTDANMSHIGDMSNIGNGMNADEPSNTNTANQDQGPQNQPRQMVNEMTLLMTGAGGRIHVGADREHTLEHLVWLVGGPRSSTRAVTAGLPFVVIGSPSDYLFGSNGLDAIVSQLLGQLDNSGPPPMSREQIEAVPNVAVTEANLATNPSCSVCWDSFQIGETVSRLECDHIFHSGCITPWLQLHATCPVCRRPLIPEAEATVTPQPPAHPATDAPPAPVEPVAPGGAANAAQPAPQPQINITSNSIPALLSHFMLRLGQRQSNQGPLGYFNPLSGTSASSGSSIAGISIWTPTRSGTNSTPSDSTSSFNTGDRERQYNTDIDYD